MAVAEEMERAVSLQDLARRGDKVQARTLRAESEEHSTLGDEIEAREHAWRRAKSMDHCPTGQHPRSPRPAPHACPPMPRKWRLEEEWKKDFEAKNKEIELLKEEVANLKEAKNKEIELLKEEVANLKEAKRVLIQEREAAERVRNAMASYRISSNSNSDSLGTSNEYEILSEAVQLEPSQFDAGQYDAVQFKPGHFEK